MIVILLTGPPAAGKNTVAEAVVKLRQKAALIDVDALRWMLRKPHVAPWQGDEGVKQAKLGISNACLLGREFLADGCDVIITDYMWSYSLATYRQLWPEVRLQAVKLMPSESVCLQRNRARGQWLTDEEVVMLYRQIAGLGVFDQIIDNEHMAANEAAVMISSFMDRSC